MSDAPHPDDDVDEHTTRHLLGAAAAGIAVFLWLAAALATTIAPDSMRRLAFVLLVLASTVTVCCAITFVAFATQRSAQRHSAMLNARDAEQHDETRRLLGEQHREHLRVCAEQHEEVLRRMRTMALWMDGMTETVAKMGDHLPAAMQDKKWQGYEEAAVDLTVPLQRQPSEMQARVVELRQFRTGDLTSRLRDLDREGN